VFCRLVSTCFAPASSPFFPPRPFFVHATDSRAFHGIDRSLTTTTKPNTNEKQKQKKVDLCCGPHLPSTGPLKAAAVTACSRAFWRGDVKREGLQRVYAVTFPEKAQLKEYQTRIAEAKKRDHRVVGVQQELFFFHPLSPGSCFFLPLGARVYNGLIGYMREKYWEYEYEEVRGGGRVGGAKEFFFFFFAAFGRREHTRRRTAPHKPTRTHKSTHAQQTGRVAQRVQL